jgi:hypothetical protein
VNIELAVVIMVFGSIILVRFLRSLANHGQCCKFVVEAKSAWMIDVRLFSSSPRTARE